MARAGVLIIGSILISATLCVSFTATNKIQTRRSSSSHVLCNAINNGEGSSNLIGGVSERREVLNNIIRGGIATTAAVAFTTISSLPAALALDFDAFESGEISKDSQTLIPKLNDDEALCKYGAPGKAMGEACKRAKIDRKLPGDVDPTGKVDRGDYLVCKYEYPDMVKTRVCKPSKEWGPS